MTDDKYWNHEEIWQKGRINQNYLNLSESNSVSNLSQWILAGVDLSDEKVSSHQGIAQ